MARMIADSDANVLLQGETGSGKDFLANHIHEIGNRSSGPFIAVNCASVPKDLLEAELFGYVPGAFTGANPKGKVGLIEAADGGTLFLDEVNSMPLELQGKLLRLLETKLVTRVGDVKSRAVNFRVLSATNQNLIQCVDAGTFRRDLYYRLNVIPITVPPLRERKEDIAPLIFHFLDYYATKYKRVKHLSPQIVEHLTEYSWPGNVRELKNLMERLVIMSSTNALEIQNDSLDLIHDIAPDALPTHAIRPREQIGLFHSQTPFFYDETRTLKENMDEYELQIIKAAVQQHGSLSKAAAALGSSKATLCRKLNQ